MGNPKQPASIELNASGPLEKKGERAMFEYGMGDEKHVVRNGKWLCVERSHPLIHATTTRYG